MGSPAQERRAQHAANTRAAIVGAARTLFAEQGYFATTVEQVARLADVSPATVYAVTGGKQGLIQALVQEWASAPVLQESVRRLGELDDPWEVLGLVAAASRDVRQQHGDVMRVLLGTAAHDSVVAEGLRTSTTRYRGTLREVAQHLQRLGALPGDVGAAEATDVLWFYFGYSGYFTLVDDNGWDMARAEQWLLTQCTRALGLPHRDARSR